MAAVLGKSRDEGGVNEAKAGTAPADLFQSAREAAERHEPAQMLEALAASRFLDGLVRRLQAKWSGKLPPMEIDDCVAQAVDSVYEAIGAGRLVRDLGAWLWKAADNIADDRWRNDYRLRKGNGDDLPEHRDESLNDVQRARLDELAEERRAEAVRCARRLIPRIGQGQIVAVMELVVEAVERGLPDLPPSIIADSLGISADAARTLLSRGFQRLRREAEREGIEWPEEIPEAEEDESEG